MSIQYISNQITNSENWWRWGLPQNSFHLDDFPKLKVFLEGKWAKKLQPALVMPDKEASLPESRFTVADFKTKYPQLIMDRFANDKLHRMKHSFGKSYHDLIKIFTLTGVPAPDFVIYPKSQEEVVYILKQSNIHKINLVTYGGGSNVTGALDVENERLCCSLDMKNLNRLVEIDEVSHTATFESGIYGPALEKILNERGFTLGHFPQSFEFSALGGWIATRSAGQESGKYGKIEDMVLGLKVANPSGVIENTGFPRHALGVDVHPLFVGSEGTLGIILQAKMQIHKIPSEYSWVVALFKDFDSGVSSLKAMVQSGIHPAVSRLSDPDETKMLSLFSNSETKGLKKIIQNQMKSYLKVKGYSAPSLLMMKFTIDNRADQYAVKDAVKIIKTNGGFTLPGNNSAGWEKNRFTLPYLRDTLVEHGVLIDTFETVTSWKALPGLYSGIRQSLEKKTGYFKNGGLLFCHISHIYQTGASLYFTLLAPQEKGGELQQWQIIKETVTDAIAELGGAISHHHGIGKDHRKWYLSQLPQNSRDLLNAIKTQLDPNDILNPGKLYDETKNNFI